MPIRPTVARNIARVASRSALPAARVATATAAAGARAPAMAVRAFSSSVPAREFDSPFGINSLNKYSEEEEAIRDVARQFAQEVVAPRVEAMDEAEHMDPEIIKGLFANGFMGVETSPDYGGAGSSFSAAIYVIEELAKVDPSVSVMCDVHNTLVATVLRKYANKNLQDKYFPRLTEGVLGSFGLSEPSSGSDAFAMKTSYKKDADGNFIINGSKMWITNAADAGFFIIFAQGDPSKGYKGISAFAVEKEMGVEIAKKEKKLGIKASSTCTLNLDEVKVPAENLVGEEGKGYKIAIEILNEGRVGIAAQMLGLAQGAYNKAVAYALEREQFGRPVASFQGMQFQMAEIAMQIEATRALVYNAARLKEEGRPFVEEAAIAKLFAANTAERASARAVEWCGGIGFTREMGIEKYLRDSKIGQIYEGTHNIMLETIWKLQQRKFKK